eukprot:scaffold54828_cov66-Phaeocystis_antarctica.AAC.3
MSSSANQPHSVQQPNGHLCLCKDCTPETIEGEREQHGQLSNCEAVVDAGPDTIRAEVMPPVRHTHLSACVGRVEDQRRLVDHVGAHEG